MPSSPLATSRPGINRRDLHYMLGISGRDLVDAMEVALGRRDVKRLPDVPVIDNFFAWEPCGWRAKSVQSVDEMATQFRVRRTPIETMLEADSEGNAAAMERARPGREKMDQLKMYHRRNGRVAPPPAAGARGKAPSGRRRGGG